MELKYSYIFRVNNQVLAEDIYSEKLDLQVSSIVTIEKIPYSIIKITTAFDYDLKKLHYLVDIVEIEVNIDVIEINNDGYEIKYVPENHEDVFNKSLNNSVLRDIIRRK